MLTRKCRALFALHKATSGVVVHVFGSSDTNVAGAFLHDDAKNNSLFHAELGSLKYCVPDTSYILPAVASLEHLSFVCVEDGGEILPCAHRRER